jgi:iron(III) transport system substrate-binding protein
MMEPILPRWLSLLILATATCGANPTSPTDAAAAEVVVYTSVDDVFARPIAEQFTKATGILVKLVPDTEETKSTGLLNRLIAEANRPQADVFWSGDPVRAAILKLKKVSAAYRSASAEGLPPSYSDPEGHWTGFSARARIILYNTDKVQKDEVPRSVFDLANAPGLRGKGCIANPLFGTTSMHAAALFLALGENGGRDFFDGLGRNRVRMLSSNGEVRRRVAGGDCAVGITDSDDAHEAIRGGKPVAMVYPDENGIGTLIVPNAAVLIANAPHLEDGKKFIDFLLRPETERALAEGDAAQIPLRSTVAAPPNVLTIDKIKPMTVDYGKLAETLDRISRGFLRQWAAKASQ